MISAFFRDAHRRGVFQSKMQEFPLSKVQNIWVKSALLRLFCLILILSCLSSINLRAQTNGGGGTTQQLNLSELAGSYESPTETGYFEPVAADENPTDENSQGGQRYVTSQASNYLLIEEYGDNLAYVTIETWGANLHGCGFFHIMRVQGQSLVCSRGRSGDRCSVTLHVSDNYIQVREDSDTPACFCGARAGLASQFDRSTKDLSLLRAMQGPMPDYGTQGYSAYRDWMSRKEEAIRDWEERRAVEEALISGDGKSEETAFYADNLEVVYEVLGQLDLRFVRQETAIKGRYHLDIVTAVERNNQEERLVFFRVPWHADFSSDKAVRDRMQRSMATSGDGVTPNTAFIEGSPGARQLFYKFDAISAMGLERSYSSRTDEIVVGECRIRVEPARVPGSYDERKVYFQTWCGDEVKSCVSQTLPGYPIGRRFPPPRTGGRSPTNPITVDNLCTAFLLLRHYGFHFIRQRSSVQSVRSGNGATAAERQYYLDMITVNNPETNQELDLFFRIPIDPNSSSRLDENSQSDGEHKILRAIAISGDGLSPDTAFIVGDRSFYYESFFLDYMRLQINWARDISESRKRVNIRGCTFTVINAIPIGSSEVREIYFKQENDPLNPENHCIPQPR